MLNLIDEHTRGCVAIHVRRRMNSSTVIEVLADAMIEHCIPEYIRSDNGPEFVAKELHRCSYAVHRTRLSMGERPLRELQLQTADEFLNGEIFYSLKEVQILAERWRIYYNTERPHSSRGYRPRAPVAWQIKAPMVHGKVESKQRFQLFHAPDCGGELTNSPSALH